MREQILLPAILALAAAARLLALAHFGRFDVATATLWEYGEQGLCAFRHGSDLCMLDRAGQPYPSAYVPPLASYLWLVLFKAMGTGKATLVLFGLINCAAGVICDLLVFRIARRLGLGVLAAALAALIFAVYPTFVFVSATYHTTNFTDALLLLGLWLAQGCARSGSLTRGALAGLSFGAAALTRTEFLPLGVVLALVTAAWLWRARSVAPVMATAMAVVMLIAMALPVSAWTLRNAAVFHRLIPAAQSDGYNLWKGFNRFADGSGNHVEEMPQARAVAEAIYASVPPGPDYEVRVQKAFRDAVDADLRVAGPVRLAWLAWRKSVFFWIFDWTDTDVVLRPAYLIPWAVANGLAVVGLIALARARAFSHRPVEFSYIAVLLAAYAGVYALAGIHARYRMHVEPLLFIFSGAGAVWALAWAGAVLKLGSARGAPPQVLESSP